MSDPIASDLVILPNPSGVASKRPFTVADEAQLIADYGVEHALRFGADAVELKVFPGNATDTKLADLRRLAAKCGSRAAVARLGKPCECVGADGNLDVAHS